VFDGANGVPVCVVICQRSEYIVFFGCRLAVRHSEPSLLDVESDIFQLVLIQNHSALQNVMCVIPPTSRTSTYCLVKGQCVLETLAEEGTRVKLYVGSLIPLPKRSTS
jgi:hypothetical protein